MKKNFISEAVTKKTHHWNFFTHTLKLSQIFSCNSYSTVPPKKFTHFPAHLKRWAKFILFSEAPKRLSNKPLQKKQEPELFNSVWNPLLYAIWKTSYPRRLQKNSFLKLFFYTSFETLSRILIRQLCTSPSKNHSASGIHQGLGKTLIFSHKLQNVCLTNPSQNLGTWFFFLIES